MPDTNRIDLSTAGVTLQYCASTGDTMPTTGYTALAGIKSIPDLNPEPSNLETTTLDETVWKTYIPGLKDVGGAIAFSANNTEKFQTDWATMVSACTATNTIGYFAVVVPGLTKAFYFKGVPSELGLSAIDVDSVLEIEGYITPTGVFGWQNKPTAG